MASREPKLLKERCQNLREALRLAEGAGLHLSI